MRRDYEGQRDLTFTDDSIRRNFVRKVYTIVMVQLMVTFGVVTFFVFSDDAKMFVVEHQEVFWLCLGITFVTVIAMACCESVRRTTPTNYMCLALFTLAESFLLGAVSCHYNPELVFTAVALTAAVTFGLTLFATVTTIDFTVCGGFLFISLIVLVIFGLVCMFFPSRTMIMIYSSAGALLFGFYLIYDTQLIVGGDHKYSISPEEYIFAALTIYIDIINLFIYILTILGLLDDG